MSAGEEYDTATMRQICAEKAGPLEQLNDHANGFLADGECREFLPWRDGVNFQLSLSSHVVCAHTCLTVCAPALICATGEKEEAAVCFSVQLRRKTDRFNPVGLGFLPFCVETAVCHVMPDRIMDTGYWTLARSYQESLIFTLPSGSIELSVA